MSTCHYCGTADGLRPYGPGGTPICFPCMKAAPDRERAAEAAYGALLDANEAISSTGAVVIGGDAGPQPFDGGDS